MVNTARKQPRSIQLSRNIGSSFRTRCSWFLLDVFLSYRTENVIQYAVCCYTQHTDTWWLSDKGKLDYIHIYPTVTLKLILHMTFSHWLLVLYTSKYAIIINKDIEI